MHSLYRFSTHLFDILGHLAPRDVLADGVLDARRIHFEIL